MLMGFINHQTSALMIFDKGAQHMAGGFPQFTPHFVNHMEHICRWCNNHLETYEFVNGKDDIPYMKWKIKHV